MRPAKWLRCNCSVCTEAAALVEKAAWESRRGVPTMQQRIVKSFLKSGGPFSNFIFPLDRIPARRHAVTKSTTSYNKCNQGSENRPIGHHKKYTLLKKSHRHSKIFFFLGGGESIQFYFLSQRIQCAKMSKSTRFFIFWNFFQEKVLQWTMKFFIPPLHPILRRRQKTILCAERGQLHRQAHSLERPFTLRSGCHYQKFYSIIAAGAAVITTANSLKSTQCGR